VHRILGPSFRGVTDEPAAVETLCVVFIRPGKVPAMSQISTQVWLPLLFHHIGVPAARAGMPTARHASTRIMERPVQVALPCSMDSFGDWLLRFRSV